jgi:hypothetical protein
VPLHRAGRIIMGETCHLDNAVHPKIGKTDKIISTTRSEPGKLPDNPVVFSSENFDFEARTCHD